jgi:NTP pyrophosphatase (non-canonical NTP hydrolase)|tara:strand:- start:6578 stop:6961 length:384 start_codon:yes stop_codon:yes gene_type:complete
MFSVLRALVNIFIEDIMKEHTLAACQQEVDDWIRNVGVRYFSELTNTAILMEEVGELARLISRTFGEQSFKEGEENDIGMEIADVLFVLVCIANQTGVDLQEEFRRTIERKTRRDTERHANNPKLSK